MLSENKPKTKKEEIMLEHQKKVLLGISDDPCLFRKEIIKSLSWLSVKEAEELYKWVKKEFGLYYAHIVGEIFCSISA